MYGRCFKNPRDLAIMAATGAIYAALTYAIAPLGYGMVQFRISEILCLLAYINPAYGIGVTLGCFFANLASPYGLFDIILGTTCSFLTVTCIAKTKNLFIASLWPTVFTIPIGIMLSLLTNVNFFVTTGYIMLSEFIVVSLIGYPFFAYICKNKKLYSLLKYYEFSVNR